MRTNDGSLEATLYRLAVEKLAAAEEIADYYWMVVGSSIETVQLANRGEVISLNKVVEAYEFRWRIGWSDTAGVVAYGPADVEPDRATYLVYCTGSEWIVRRVDAPLEAGRFTDRQSAVFRARELADGFKPSRVVVLQPNGETHLDYPVG